ncbi:MAG: flagellar M-ring protein FliF [Roseovarius sp.]|uniref:flagellar basal-body MS-ring/collar protein FliF n=1 Tax=Roseovarius sp. TaxID=1486281 RepID=UPI00199591E5|nr:flagellar basal-body MS-ring/collar protein FliF [Roseovarius sp.]MBC7180312.1 flagellar M-ring protein FliF [Roseovarius sp.]MBQ0752559.1 flagellar M-ring protein FliF [Roseovarius sp.]MBQ0811534.1 flagellar M-ring protein FliF [Roseovarius sp.]
MDGQQTTLPAQAGATSLVQRARLALSGMDGFIAQPALRRALPAIGVLLVVTLGLAAWLLLAPADRVTLHAGLPEAEKSLALEALTAAGMDAQLDPSSGALTVAADQYHSARMLLASQGLPEGATDGMSAIDEMPMGTSRQIESARLRRMQELDLARSIQELRPVRAARVHLALPERSAFVRDSQPPRASVFLELAPGMTLDQAQVRAIVSLVAAAVPDMPRSNVSVVDQTGTLLTSPEEDPVQAEADRQMQHQRRLEAVYRDRVLALLTPIVGAGNAAVEVTLDMDFTRSEITSEEYLPDTALRSEQSSSQQTNGAQAGGVPGAVANTPPNEAQLAEAATQGAKDGTTNSATSSTRNYEVSRRVETRQPQTAQISRVHAAVLLHRLPTPAAPAEGDAAPAPEAVPLAEIEALTRSAIGFDDTRGDIVTVASAPFVVAPSMISAERWYDAAWLPTLGRTLAQLALFGIIVLGVVRPILNRLLPPVGATTASTGMTYGDAIEVPRGESLSALRQRLETAAPSADDLNGAITYEEKIDLLRQMAGAETNRIAGVFKSMIAPTGEDRP